MTSSPDVGATCHRRDAPPARPWDGRFLIGVIVILLLLTSLPYLYGYLSAPPGKRFMGILLNVPDHAQYFSWMRELSQANLAANKLTPEPNDPAFFNLLWWPLGRLGRLLGTGYAVPFQILRITAIPLFLFIAYWWCRSCYPDRLTARTCLLAIVFASGFGWVLVLLKYTLMEGTLPLPLDLYVAEANTFFCMMAYPHFTAAALYIAVFPLFLRTQATGEFRYAVAGGVLALVLGWQHAYDLVLVYGILGAFVLALIARDRIVPWRAIKALAIIGILSVWPAIYSVLLTSLDPIWKQVLAQFSNAGVFTPPLYRLPILLGLAFLLALFGELKDGLFRLDQLDDLALFVKAWFWANMLLIYIPADFQIHMLNGWQVPIVILAIGALLRHVMPLVHRVARQAGWQISRAGVTRLVCAAFLIAIVPTNLYLWAWRFVDLARGDYPYYLHEDELAAMAWLEAHAGPDDVVLSSEMIGQYVPMLTGKRAFLAHWAQTVDYFDKRARAARFFDGTSSDLERLETIEQFGIDYVFYGPAEQDIGRYNPDSSTMFSSVFFSEQVTLFAVYASQ